MRKNHFTETPRDLVALQDAVAALPKEHRARIEAILTRHTEATRRRRRITQLVNEALNQLRLDMKYLIFDLEATRKERDEARKAVGGDLS